MTFPKRSEIEPRPTAWRWSHWLVALTGAAALTLGCGGSQPPAETASEPPAADADSAPDDVAALPEEEPEESWGDEDTTTSDDAPRSGAAPDAGATKETRTLEVIQKVVNERRAAVRACYDKAREKNSALPGGDFVVRIVIDPEGVVKSAEQDFDASAVKSPDLSKCAIAEILTWKFPPSSRGMETKVNYPFNFKP
ncbi:MAG: AgmX/PglI C-terminal domain-containing protein [Myxococcales bacterium]|nr:AgmX/PglI C-terminal domain-containing protein [Myxococcales bacterium]